jgi:hypothetical protein
MRKAWFFYLLLPGLLAGCTSKPPVNDLPEVSETLDAIGRRLSQSLSESRLTVLAGRGSELLTHLKWRERDALGRGYLRFHSSGPVVVEVATPESTVPFWIHDQGFVPTGEELSNPDCRWRLFRRVYPSGWIGLGVNGLDRRPPAHYVVFLRSPGDPQSLSEDSIALGQESAKEWLKLTAQAGVSAARDVSRPFASIPAKLEGAVLLQPFHDRRHSALLARGRVWKTRVPSGESADQVTISYGSDPGHELVWSWRTAPGFDRTSLRIVPARFEAGENDTRLDPDLTGMRLVEGDSTLVRSPNLLNDPVIRRHVVIVGDLSPDTTYLYSLKAGKDVWSPWRTAKTGKSSTGRLEFLYMGDAQTGLQDWGRRLFTAFRRHPGIEFLMLAGDLVDRGNERTNWDHLFLRAEEIFERIPVMPCVGNHEYLDMGPRLYQSFFALPQNGPAGVAAGLVYHFEVGSAFIAVLDSTLAVSDDREARRQAVWLDEALHHTRAEWKLVMFHHPVYPSHPWRDAPALREHWVPVFDKYRVDLVLQGHDHAYLRTYPMRGHRRTSTGEPGTVYVVSVAGDKFCDQAQRDYIEVGFTDTSTYQTIEIDDRTHRLTYRAWTDSGDVADRFVLTHPGAVEPSAFAGRERAPIR